MWNSFLKIPVFIVLIIVVSTSCQAPAKVSLYNLVALYQEEKQFSTLNSWIYRTTDSTVTLFTEVNFSDLVYQKDPYTGLYSSSYRLSYKLSAGYDAKEIITTESVVSGDSLNYGKNSAYVHSFEIKTSKAEGYLVEISLFDFNRQSASTKYIWLPGSSRTGRQAFLVLNQNKGLIYRNYIDSGEPFKIVINDPEIHHLYVGYYHREFPVARPPYTEDREPVFEYRPDSVFLLPLFNGESDWININSPGFYHFRKDTLNRTGLTLFNHHEGFPELLTADDLREPLRYITTKKEYDTLINDPNSKAAIDNFWLKTAQSPDRAKILIQKYYSNVEESNNLFTSYVEGWKTDRGLIYIVFGRPDYVYRSNDSEEWIYGEPQNRSSLRFTFVKVNNPFTDNDYMLLRSPTFKEPWFITVQSWRR